MPKREDPLVGYHFAVDIEGVVKGYFLECSGLGSEHEVIEKKVVDKKGRATIIKLPGRLKWDNITLRRGMTSNMEIWRWRRQVEEGDVEAARRNGSIIMLDERQNEVARWNFERAWPIKLSGPLLNAGGNEVAIEELTLVHERIERVS